MADVWDSPPTEEERATAASTPGPWDAPPTEEEKLDAELPPAPPALGELPEVQGLRRRALGIAAAREAVAQTHGRASFTPSEADLEVERAVQAGGDVERRLAYASLIAGNTDLNPEQAAQARQVAAATGLPADMVVRNLPTLWKRFRAQSTADQLRALAAAHPELADDLLENPARFAQVRDASADAASWGEFVAGRWAPVTAAEAAKDPSAPAWVKEFAQKHPDVMVSGGFQPGPLLATARDAWTKDLPALARKLAQAETGAPRGLADNPNLSPFEMDVVREDVGERPMAAPPRPGMLPPTEAAFPDWREENERQIQALERESTGAKDYGPLSRRVLGKVLTAPGRMSPVLAGNLAAAGAGPQGIFMFNWAWGQGPLAYDLQKQEGVDPARASELATAGSGLGAAFFSIPIARLGGRLLTGTETSLLNRATAEATERALAIPQVSQLILRATAASGEEYASGMLGMVAQSISEEGARQIASGIFDPHRFQEVARQTAKQAAVDLLPLAAGGAGYTMVLDVVARQAAAKSAQDLRSLPPGPKLAKVLEVAPEQGRELLLRLAQDARVSPDAVTSVHQDLVEWDRYWQGQKLDPRAAAAMVLRDGGKAYDLAKASHADRLEIPVADWAATLGVGENGRHGLALLEDAATAANVNTPRQEAAEAKRRAERMKELQALSPEKMEADQALVFGAYREQALAAGEAEKVATANAQLYSAALKTLAERAGRGETAWDLWQANPLRIVRGEDGAPLAAAAQAQRLSQPAFHGTHNERIQRFSLAKIGTGTGLAAEGWGIYASSKEAIADLYRERAVRDAAFSGGDVGEGRVYHLDVPENTELLALRDPLSAQPAEVRAALDRAGLLQGNEQLTGKELYKRLAEKWKAGELPGVEAQRADEAASKYLGTLGIKGARYPAELSIGGERGTNFVTWDEPSIRILEEAPPERLNQGSRIGDIEGRPLRLHKEGDRGFIDISPAGPGEPIRMDIHLLGSDRSTLAHESFHGLSKLMGQLATRDGAPAALRADYQALLEAMGYKDHAERQSAPVAAKEEKASHLWEMYLAEGKAPTAELLPAFARFRAWLSRIYRGVVGIREQYRKRYGQDLELSDDVRSLFGRILAGDEAVANAAREVRLETPEVKLTPEEAAESARLLEEARARAQVELQRQMVQEDRSTDREFMREARTQVEHEIAARLEEQDPVYRAQAALERGEVHGLPLKLALDPAGLREIVGSEAAAQLPKKYFDRENGLPPDTVASILGFESAHELVRQLVNAEPRAERLKRETSARMAELYPRLQDRPELLRGLAREALGNDALLRDGLLRLRALEREAGLPPTRSRLEDIKDAAAEAVKQKTIAELRPDRLEAAARGFARRASEVQDAQARRDAFESYLFNQAMAQSAREARARSEKTARVLLKFSTEEKLAELGKVIEKGPNGEIVQPYRDAMVKLLSAFEFRASASVKEVRTREVQRAAIEKWVKERWADGDSVIIPDSIMEKLGRATHWKDLTPGELEDLRTAAQSIAQQADLRNKYRVGGQRVETEKVIGDLAAAAIKNGAGLSDDRLPRLRDRIAEWKRQGKHAVEYLELVFDELDGFAADGPWKKFIWDPISDASYRYYDLVRKTTGRVQELLEGLTAAQRSRLKNKTFTVDGREYTLEMAMGALANAGNESNLSKTVRGNSDPNIAAAFHRTPWFGIGTLEKIVAHLTKDDAELVGEIHKMLDSLRPEMEALEKEETGAAPRWIKAKPFKFVGADGKEITIEGGYYPMLYERKTRVGKTQREAEAFAANGLPGLFQPGYERVATPGSHLEARIDNFARPVDLTFDRLPGKLTASAKDIAFRIPAKQAYRVLMDERVAGALYQALGEHGHDLVMGWLRDSVNDVMLPDQGAALFLRFMSWAKGRTYRAIFGYNAGQAFQNLADLAVALPQKRMMDAALQLARDIPGWRDKILAESAEMRLRADGAGKLSEEMRSTFKRSEIGILWDRFGDIGMIPFDLTNAAGEYTIYLGSKLHALDQGMSEADAIRHANSMVRRTFGGRRTVDLTPIQRNVITRHFTMFWGWAAANLNQWIRSRAQSGVFWSDGMKALALKTVARTVAVIAAKALLSELLTGKGPKDDDKDGLDAGDVGRWVAFRSVMAVPSMLPIAGSAVRSLAGGEAPRDLSLTPYMNLADGVFRALSKTVSAAMHPDELEAEQEVNLFLAWLEAGGQFTGGPVTQARSTVRYWMKPPEGANAATDILGTIYGPDRAGKLSHLTVSE